MTKVFAVFSWIVLMSLPWSPILADEGTDQDDSWITQWDYDNLGSELREDLELSERLDRLGPETLELILDSKLRFLSKQIETEQHYIRLLSFICILFLFLVLMFLKLTASNLTPRNILNASGLILIVFGTIMLVIIVDTSEQLTAAIGLLGAIGGYLFGTLQKKEEGEG